MKDNKQSNVIVFKDNILVQLTKNYHVPFKLSAQEAQTLWDGLDMALGEYNSRHAKRPWCECGHKREEHVGDVGKCKRQYHGESKGATMECDCEAYDLDVTYYRPSENYETDEDDDIE